MAAPTLIVLRKGEVGMIRDPSLQQPMANVAGMWRPRPASGSPPTSRASNSCMGAPAAEHPEQTQQELLDQDHGTEMGPDCPARAHSGRHRPTRGRPAAQHKRPRPASAVTVRHVRVLTCGPPRVPSRRARHRPSLDGCDGRRSPRTALRRQTRGGMEGLGEGARGRGEGRVRGRGRTGKGRRPGCWAVEGIGRAKGRRPGWLGGRPGQMSRCAMTGL